MCLLVWDVDTTQTGEPFIQNLVWLQRALKQGTEESELGLV